MQAKTLRTLALGAAAFALALVAPSQASAQFQVQANYNLDAEQFGVGGGYTFGLGSLTANNGISGRATFDYYLKTHGVTRMEGNFNGLMDIKSVAGLFVGAGVGISHTSAGDVDDFCDTFGVDCDASSSDFHLNILGGYSFGKPFVEAAFLLGGGSSLRLGGGIRF